MSLQKERREPLDTKQAQMGIWMCAGLRLPTISYVYLLGVHAPVYPVIAGRQDKSENYFGAAWYSEIAVDSCSAKSPSS